MMAQSFHLTSVALNGQAVLLAGPAGVGKTDVALRLIETGGTLIADDQTFLRVHAGRLLAAPPTPIAGLIELRHVGLYKLPFVADVPVALYVELVPSDTALERLPPPAFTTLLDQRVRLVRLVGCEASTPAKIRIALGERQDE